MDLGEISIKKAIEGRKVCGSVDVQHEKNICMGEKGLRGKVIDKCGS